MAPKRGGLSLARKKELQNLFHSADTDASGLLSFTEMSMVLREGNPSLSDKELALLFREIDTNGDLTVDFKEFARYLNSMSASKLKKSKSREQVAAERCKEEFWRVDENSDGTLSRGEMTMLLRKGNPEITEEELELLFDTMDQDGNGSLDFSEFVDYITGAKTQGPEPEPEQEEKLSATIFWVDAVPLPEVYQQRSSHIAMAHERAIDQTQLDELMTLMKEVLEAVSICEGTQRLIWGSLNMYQASEHFLKPLTLRFNPCSFVELVATEPQVPEWFVSHWWGTPLVQTVAMLKYHREQREGKASAWWIDSFARCLHCVQLSRFPAPKDLEDAAFCKVLISTSCVGSVVLLDSSGTAFSRSWCLLEFALSLDMPKDKSTGHVIDVVAWNHPLKKAGLLVDVGQGKSEEVLRENGAVFPLDLYSKGYRVAVHKSEASVEADRKRILHFLASTPADSWDRLKPPTDKEAYSTVHASLQQRFIAGAMAASAVADDEKALKKIATDYPESLESCWAHGFRPVHAAAMKGSLQALKLLVGLQCNVNAAATDGRTPLYLAAREGHDATVLYLLKNKAEVDATSGGKTALHASIEGGHITISGSLLDHKADPNISAGAEAPLLLAAREDQAATCGLLLDFKADPSKESAEGKKCYELVKHSTKLVETLKKAVQDAQPGMARSSRRRPSVGEERMVRDLSAICSKEVKGSRIRP